MIYHRGLARSLGVTEGALEDMTIREMVERAHERGGDLVLKEGGEGPGLTLRAESDEQIQHAESGGIE